MLLKSCIKEEYTALLHPVLWGLEGVQSFPRGQVMCVSRSVKGAVRGEAEEGTE